MIQVRIHGRGGQGVVTAADLISCAAFADGHYAQSFPSFGSERTGAPVVSYCRIDSGPIRLREPVLYPDVVLVQDATLLGAIPVCSGLKAKGFVLINSAAQRAFSHYSCHRMVPTVFRAGTAERGNVGCNCGTNRIFPVRKYGAGDSGSIRPKSRARQYPSSAGGVPTS